MSGLANWFDDSAIFRAKKTGGHLGMQLRDCWKMLTLVISVGHTGEDATWAHGWASHVNMGTIRIKYNQKWTQYHRQLESRQRESHQRRLRRSSQWDTRILKDHRTDRGTDWRRQWLTVIWGCLVELNKERKWSYFVEIWAYRQSWKSHFTEAMGQTPGRRAWTAA